MAGIYQKISLFVLFFIISSASFSGFYQKWHFAEEGVPGQYENAGFQAMVDGTAWRPYVYRQMLPTIANWADSATPQPIKDRLYKGQGKTPFAFIQSIAVSQAATSNLYFFRYLIVYAGTFLFALLAVFALYIVCRALELSAPVATFSSSVFMLLIPYFMSLGGYFYDFPELFFIAMAVWVTLKFDWWWAIPVVALGTWNKESFLLLIPTLYPMIRRRSSRIGAMAGIATLVLICLMVYFPERAHFAHNPGATMEFRLFDQLQLLAHPKKLLLDSEDTFGIRMVKGFTLFPLFLLIWTVVHGWKKLPALIRRHGKIAAAINFPFYFLFCGPGELRDLSLLYIFFLAVLAFNLKDWLGEQTVIATQASEVLESS